MPALVKVNTDIASGGLALVNYELRKDSSLTLTLNAEFVTTASASVESLFGSGSQPPEVLRSNAVFQATLSSLGARRVPTLIDVASVVHAGLKTIRATYTAGANTTISAQVSDGASADSGTLVQVPVLAEGGEVQNVGLQIGGGSGIIEYTSASALRSLSGTYTDPNDEEASLSFSFDYYSITNTVISEANASVGQIAGSVGSPFNVRGIIPRGSLSVQQISTFRNSANSAGQSKSEITASAIYVFEG
jgi:hypothetical protein